MAKYVVAFEKWVKEEHLGLIASHYDGFAQGKAGVLDSMLIPAFSMLIKQFDKIHKQKKESILVISHQEKLIQMADRILLLKDGKIDSIGTKEELKDKLYDGTLDRGCKYSER